MIMVVRAFLCETSAVLQGSVYEYLCTNDGCSQKNDYQFLKVYLVNINL